MAHSAKQADPALLIAPRFCGPPGSGNGGYVSGRVAAYLDSAGLNGPVTVTLRKPPPLDAHMAVARDGDGALRVTHDGALIAEATPAEAGPALEVPERVSAQQAHTAVGRAAYYADPVFPWLLRVRHRTASRATGCASSPDRYTAGRCGRRRGHRTSR